FAVAVEVRGAVGEGVERGTEVTERFAGDGHAEPDVRLGQALAGGVHTRRGAHEDGAGDPSAHAALPEHGLLVVDGGRGGVGSVDVGVDDRLPAVLQVVRQFLVDTGVVYGHVTGHDHGAHVLV